MTKDDTWELVEFITTTTLAGRYPELDRQVIRMNVRASLATLRAGLTTAFVCGITGELTEVGNRYGVRS
jgi:hypothetical protein